MNRWLMLLIFICLCFGVAATAAGLTRASVQGWYLTIQKPSWNPPNWVFGPVWSTLYLMMAIAAWLVWLAPPQPRRGLALAIFFLQLALNFLWSPLFFRWHAIGAAFAEILVLWCAIGAFAVLSWQVSRVAALLFLPYWLWVSFAAYLNYTIWILNRARGVAS